MLQAAFKLAVQPPEHPPRHKKEELLTQSHCSTSVACMNAKKTQLHRRVDRAHSPEHLRTLQSSKLCARLTREKCCAETHLPLPRCKRGLRDRDRVAGVVMQMSASPRGAGDGISFAAL